MKDVFAKIYKKILYAYKSSSKSYIKYLKKKGVLIGDNVSFYEPNTNYIDDQLPFLVEIGDNVEITRGVTIITHDYSWSVIKQITGEIIGARSKVKIGNNVFIGVNTTIMKGVTIGNNVIIGANSLVTKDIPSNSVVCGNPAHVISNIEDYYKKRISKYKNEAEDIFIEYYKIHNSVPDKKIFHEFFWLFEERDRDLIPEFKIKMELTGNYGHTMKKYCDSKPIFDGYDEFVEYCMKRIEKK